LDAETAAGASGVECFNGGCASTLLVIDTDAADSNRAGCRVSRNRRRANKDSMALQWVINRELHGICYV